MPSRFHRVAVQGAGRQDTQADINHRIAARHAGEQAVRERAERFPVLTANNAQAAIDWQKQRLRELMAPINAAWHEAQQGARR